MGKSRKKNQWKDDKIGLKVEGKRNKHKKIRREELKDEEYFEQLNKATSKYTSYDEY